MKRIGLALFGLVAGTAMLAIAGSAAATDAAPTGKDIFMKYKCQGCHAISAQKIGTDAAGAEADEETDVKDSKGEKEADPPDLSDVGTKAKAEFLNQYLRKKEPLNGKLHKKRFKGTPEERDSLVTWLMTLKDKPAAVPPPATAPAAGKTK